MNQEPGLMQGYYIGAFFKFLWYLLLATIMQSMIVFIFGTSFFTIIILSVLFSFFINTSLYIKDSYPFLRHILIYGCVYYVQAYWMDTLIGKLYRFYMPDNLWTWMISISFIIGILTSFGRYNNGTHSKNLETLGNMVLLIFVLASFYFFGWKGAVVFIVFRVMLISLEVWASNLLTYLLFHRGKTGNYEDLDA
ncbi:hypothetical protein [Paenibacillus sp. FSL R10-2734]|uniref:hypothetical protein n=1 Tax=Paenibacillus sp. FSL R10-2734 TaxID=2954691 RepID=UPI0030D8653B